MNKLRITILAITLLLLTFVRENTFLVINGAIQGGNSYKAYIEIPNFLREMAIEDLIFLKWSITFCFIVLFGLLSYLIVSLLFNNRTYNYFMLGSFAVISMASLLLFGLSSVLWQGFYAPARMLLTLVQSPVLVMVMVIFKYSKEKFNDYVT